MKKLFALLGAIALIVASSSVSWSQPKGGETTVRVAGADSMFYRVKLRAKLFTKANPSVKIDVSQGGTMDSGIRALIEGQADLAMASCVLLPEEDKLAAEKRVKLVERVIGYGGITVVVNSDTGVDSLCVDDVRKLMVGEYANWKQVGGADLPVKVVRTDARHPGTLAFLERDFLRKSFAPHAIVVSSFPSVVATVADTPGAIGYVRIREASESPVVKSNPRVKVVPIARSASTIPVMPSRKAVEDQSYCLVRPYLVYYLSTAKPEAVEFADYLVKKGWGAQDL
ncbi:MAG: substrate-binding domain-containing protein [Pseudomonadota bacterium]